MPCSESLSSLQGSVGRNMLAFEPVPGGVPREDRPPLSLMRVSQMYELALWASFISAVSSCVFSGESSPSLSLTCIIYKRGLKTPSFLRHGEDLSSDLLGELGEWRATQTQLFLNC